MNSRFIVNVEQGLKEAGFEVTTDNWLNRFDETVRQSKEAYYGKMRQKLAENGPAVFLEILTNPFTEGIGAILLMSQAGNIGGYALVDVLTGKAAPSGHLTTTWAENYMDYLGADSFSFHNGDLDDEYYQEGIYVGYRYFDTFGIKPAYPFGYGKSYTDFAVGVETVKADAKQVEVTVKVTNIGAFYGGKEVVQIYYSAPSGRLEKPYQELAAYAKTGELAPGESEVLTIAYPTSSMASYDTKKAAFVMEAGVYYIRVGNHSRNTHVVAALCLDKEAVTEFLSNRLTPNCEIEELSAGDGSPYTYETEKAEKEAALQIPLHAADFLVKTAVYRKENVEIAHIGDAGADRNGEVWKLTDVIAGKITLDELVGQLTVEELAALCVGASRGGIGNATVIGSASVSCPGAAGDTTSELLGERGVTNIALADGPAGLRLVKSFVTDQEHNYDLLQSSERNPYGQQL